MKEVNDDLLAEALAAAQITFDRPVEFYEDENGWSVFGGHVDEEYGPCRITTGTEFDDEQTARAAAIALCIVSRALTGKTGA